ncbi:MAG: hypothetical protein ACRCZ9_06185 [Fusobacteriaceae bacterium]
MDKRRILYERIKDIQNRKNLTIVKISELTGISKQTISHRILRIKKSGTIDLDFIQKIEEISGEEIIKF